MRLIVLEIPRANNLGYLTEVKSKLNGFVDSSSISS